MASARELIDASPLSRLQIRVILLCTLVNMAEGYDILSMSLAILPITDDWGILTVTKGALMSPAWNNVTVSIPTKTEEEKILGDGWTLELKHSFIVQKEDSTDHYILGKK